MWAGTVNAENEMVRSAETVELVEGNIACTARWRGAGELRGVGDPMHACKPTTGTWEVFTLRRRSQRDRFSWQRLQALVDQYWPKPWIRHPWPGRRFDVKYPR